MKTIVFLLVDIASWLNDLFLRYFFYHTPQITYGIIVIKLETIPLWLVSMKPVLLQIYFLTLA